MEWLIYSTPEQILTREGQVDALPMYLGPCTTYNISHTLRSVVLTKDAWNQFQAGVTVRQPRDLPHSLDLQETMPTRLRRITSLTFTTAGLQQAAGEKWKI